MAASKPDALVGSHLGKEYWIVDRIGDGGMGVVYLVEHRGLKKQFAAKILTRDLAENPEARARFEMEARAASQLDHENIISVTDYGIGNDDRPFIVMELLRGQPLDARLAERPMSLGETAAVIVPICNALAEAHARGIVHRDIKPENVFLVARAGGRFLVKVVDFGIAKAQVTTSRITKLGQVLGSPLYMAPEACRGEDVDHRADIYSVGVLLFQLATGRLPFEDSNLLRVMNLQTNMPPPRPRDLHAELPEAVEAVILRALAKNAGDRFQQVEELATALVAALPPGADELLRAPAIAPVRTPMPGTPGTRTPTPGTRTPTPRRAPDELSGGPTLMAQPKSPTTLLQRPAPVSKPPALAATITSTDGLPAPPRPNKLRWAWLLLGAATIALGVLVAWPRREPARLVSEPPAPVVAPPAAVVTPPPAAEPEPPPAAPSMVSLRVTSTPSGAEVFLAGRRLGLTPLATRVEPTSRKQVLEVRLAGRKVVSREIELAADLALELPLPALASSPRRPGPGPEKVPPPDAPPPSDLDIRGNR